MNKRLLRRWRRATAGAAAEVSTRDLLLILAPVIVVAVAVVWVAVVIVRPAPPKTITFSGGPPGSIYGANAEKYRQIIERYGIKVKVLPSEGALENLRRLADRKVRVDVAFVQGGLNDKVDVSGLVSLGSMWPQPLLVYYRGTRRVDMVSELAGKRIAIGIEGSGTRALALTILAANEIDASKATLLAIGGENAAKALAAGTVDAAFFTGDSVTGPILRSVRNDPDLSLMSFRQSGGYQRRFRFLNHFTLPEGAFDLGKDDPPHPVELIGTTVELVAREDLHPALSDLLIRAAREVHSSPGLFRDAGEYPSAQQHEFPISDDAERYYKSGEHFLYKRLPFWLANLIDRTLVVLVPLIVLLLPATRVAPIVYRWRVRSRIYRWYGALMQIERDLSLKSKPEERTELLQRLDEIEQAVNEIETPLSFADQLYFLREHVTLVRHRIQGLP
jgi:TRAP transporter TAXI family solute receptor